MAVRRITDVSRERKCHTCYQNKKQTRDRILSGYGRRSSAIEKVGKPQLEMAHCDSAKLNQYRETA